MIFDAFPFNNETLLLELRLQMLSPFVDAFVIQEVGETHSGIKKGLLARSVVTKLGLSDRVVFQSVESFPEGLSTFERDWFQRNLLDEFLKREVSDNDLLLYGDVDEIPDPQRLRDAADSMTNSSAPFAAFAQWMHYCFFNMREKSSRLHSYLGEFDGVSNDQKRWIGSILWRGSAIAGRSAANLRDREIVDLNDGFRVAEGGWHFSYVDGHGDPFDRFVEKLSNSAHQEFNNDSVHKNFHRRISRGRDPLGRRGVRFERVPGAVLPPDVRRLFAEHPDKFL